MDINLSQRWNARQPRWAPERSVIDPDRYFVEAIEERDAKRFCETYHYSGSVGPVRLAVGLRRRNGGGENPLVGVAVFGVLLQPAAATRWCSLPSGEVPDLNRLVLLDDVEFNGESFFMARAMRIAQERLNGVKALISYTDPVPRYTTDGRQVLRGHVGTIYKSLGMRFVGRGAARTLTMDQHGKVVSERSLSKLKNGERGSDYVARQLFMAGAPERRFGESGRDYARRAIQEGPFRKFRHPGCLVYVTPMTDKEKVAEGFAPALPYLKRSELGL